MVHVSRPLTVLTGGIFEVQSVKKGPEPLKPYSICTSHDGKSAASVLRYGGWPVVPHIWVVVEEFAEYVGCEDTSDRICKIRDRSSNIVSYGPSASD